MTDIAENAHHHVRRKRNTREKAIKAEGNGDVEHVIIIKAVLHPINTI